MRKRPRTVLTAEASEADGSSGASSLVVSIRGGPENDSDSSVQLVEVFQKPAEPVDILSSSSSSTAVDPPPGRRTRGPQPSNNSPASSHPRDRLHNARTQSSSPDDDDDDDGDAVAVPRKSPRRAQVQANGRRTTRSSATLRSNRSSEDDVARTPPSTDSDEEDVYRGVSVLPQTRRPGLRGEAHRGTRSRTATAVDSEPSDPDPRPSQRRRPIPKRKGKLAGKRRQSALNGQRRDAPAKRGRLLDSEDSETERSRTASSQSDSGHSGRVADGGSITTNHANGTAGTDPIATLELSDEDGDVQKNTPTRHHARFCHHCGRTGAELACQHCTRVLHLVCAQPPQVSVPRTYAWKCQRCILANGDNRVAEILSVRARKGEEDGTRDGDDDEEFLVRRHGQSYRNAVWLPRAEVEAQAEQKLRNFRARLGDQSQREGSGWECGIWHEWKVVDRVLAEHEDLVLVKWKSLTYDLSTWEVKEVVQRDFPEQYAQYVQSLTWEGVKRRKSPAARPIKFSAIEASRPPFLASGCELFDYQVEGFNWLRFNWFSNVNVVLGDEMGLGKTIQTVAYIASLHASGWISPYLVIGPLSTVSNWYREFRHWAPHMNVMTYLGTKEAREIARKYEFFYPPDVLQGKSRKERRTPRCHVVITSYEMVVNDAKENRFLARLGEYHSVVIDEGHRLKGGAAARLHGALQRIQASHMVLLTGTPLQNNLEELYNLLNFLDPGAFDQNNFHGKLHSEEQVAELHEILKPRLLLRTKNDVHLTLPAKHELVVPIQLSKLQRDCYRAILEKNFHVLREENRVKILRNIFMELRKCCNHPYLVGDVEPLGKSPEENLRFMVSACGKFQMLDRMLPALKAKGHRVLIFSQMVMVLDMIEDYLNLREFEFERIDGNVRGDLRQLAIDRFNVKDSKKFVFLLSTRAGGLGINLATADTVFIYDSDWNPHMDLQALARAHRIGQQAPVLVYRFITEHSVEERMLQIAQEKLLLTNVVVHKMNENMTKESLIDVIRHGAEVTLRDNKEDDPEEERQLSEEAVAKLLDRDQIFATLEKGKEEATEKGLLGDLTKARTWTNGKENVEESTTNNKQQPADKPATEFWDSLLRDRANRLELERLEDFGRGKRTRKRVDYRQDVRAGKGDRAASDEGEDPPDRGDDVVVDAAALGSSSSSNTAESDPPFEDNLAEISHAVATAGAPIDASSTDPVPKPAKPPDSLSHKSPISFKLLSNNDRHTILCHMLTFGIPITGCDDLKPAVASKLRGNPTPKVVSEFARRVMHGLQEGESSAQHFRDGLAKGICKGRTREFKWRLNTMALIRTKLTEVLLSGRFAINDGECTKLWLRWNPAKDDADKAKSIRRMDLLLLYGLHIHGWNTWEEIVKDTALGAIAADMEPDIAATDVQRRAYLLVEALRLEFTIRSSL